MLSFLELLAVLSSAAFGVLLARSKQMDLIGVCTVAFVVAFGGGTLRDVLLDRRPLFWIQNEHYTWFVFALAVIGSFLPRIPARMERWLHLPDALGLGMFSVVGAAFALREGLSFFHASLFGVMTGTFGGVMAEVMCNEVPGLFRRSTPLYASCAFFGAWVYLGLGWLEVEQAVATWSAVAATVASRLTALRFAISIPAPRD